MQVSLEEIPKLLNEKYSNELEVARLKSSKICEKIRDALNELSTEVECLEQEARETREKGDLSTPLRTALKFTDLLVKKLPPVISSVSVPEEISYHSLNSFLKDLYNAIVKISSILNQCLPKINPYFFRRRRKIRGLTEDLIKYHDMLRKHLAEDYGIAMKIENIERLVDKIEERKLTIETHLSSMRELETRMEEINARINEIKSLMDELMKNPKVREFHEISSRKDSLTREAEIFFNILRKPMLRLNRLLESGKIYVNPLYARRISRYAMDPLTYFINDRDSLEVFKEAFKALEENIDKMKLSSSKKKLVLKRISEAEKLAKLKEELNTILEREQSIKSDPAFKEAIEQLERHRKAIEQLEKEKAYLLEKINSLNHKIEQLENSIEKLKERIIADASSLLGEAIELKAD